jgi:ankyrin repeat protein
MPAAENQSNKQYYQALEAIEAQNTQEAISIVRFMPVEQLNIMTYEGETTLMNAAIKAGMLGVVEQLVKRGASINEIVGLPICSPLLLAIRCNKPEIALWLILQNTINQETLQKSLFEALAHRNEAIINALVHTLPDIDIKDHNGITPLQYAIELEYIEGVKALLAKGAKINNASTNNRTPLYDAFKKNRPEIVQLVIAALESINQPVYLEEFSAMQVAAICDSTAAATALIAKGANLNQCTTRRQSTLLHLAAESNSVNVVNILIEAGANRDAKNALGLTPLDLANKMGHTQVGTVLKSAPAANTLCFSAAKLSIHDDKETAAKNPTNRPRM